MNELTKFHYQNCREYKKILDLVYEYKNYEDIEFYLFFRCSFLIIIKSIPSKNF